MTGIHCFGGVLAAGSFIKREGRPTENAILTARCIDRGALELITMVLSPFSEWVHFPPSLIPIALTKFVSSSAATGLILDLFKVFGPRRHGINVQIFYGKSRLGFISYHILQQNGKAKPLGVQKLLFFNARQL